MLDKFFSLSSIYYKELIIVILVAISILYTKNRTVAMAICTVLLVYYFYIIFFKI